MRATLRMMIPVIALCAFCAAATGLHSPAVATFRAQADSIVVEKSRRQLSLYAGKTLIGSYSISLGTNPVGDKEREGDGRTPEGNYRIDRRNSDSRFHLALHISYPNAADMGRALQAGVPPGGDIMIHGSPYWWPFDGFGPPGDWTEGCIAVTNREMDEIWNLVLDGATIEIRP
jgi:murein L,D-transpeptidase YafK